MLTIETLPLPREIGVRETLVLEDDLQLQNTVTCYPAEVSAYIVSKGMKVEIYEGSNFLYVILPKGAKDRNGDAIPRRIFRY